MMHELDKFDGQRLAFLRAPVLRMSCRCGHDLELPVTELARQFGEDTRVRTLFERLTCPRCGLKHFRAVARLGSKPSCKADNG